MISPPCGGDLQTASWLSRVTVNKTGGCRLDAWTNCLMREYHPFVDEKNRLVSLVRDGNDINFQDYIDFEWDSFVDFAAGNSSTLKGTYTNKPERGEETVVSLTCTRS